jgi:hypothetical protein
MMLLRPLVTLAVITSCSFFAGCGKRDSHAHSASGGHAHTAPHGGKLVELGEHAYNLELVHDRAAGKLTAYVLDGHAENFIRINAPAFDAIATVSGEKRRLTFQAVANTATGETVGETSQFEAQADWLKTTPTFELVIPQIGIRGRVFANTVVNFAANP